VENTNPVTRYLDRRYAERGYHVPLGISSARFDRRDRNLCSYSFRWFVSLNTNGCCHATSERKAQTISGYPQ